MTTEDKRCATPYEEYKVIYLEPVCTKCFHPYAERLWHQDRQENCTKCGKPWVKYELSNDKER
jgi:hypothetical protein